MEFLRSTSGVSVMKVSIILATHNRAEMLRRCISSLLNQTHSDFELIVADDGSTDHTEEVFQSFTDQRMRYLKMPHRDVYVTRNEAFKKSKGDYIAVADDDDVYHQDHLKHLVDTLDDNLDIGCAYSGTIRVDPLGNVQQVMPLHEFSMARLLWGRLLMHGATMWRRKWMKKYPYPNKFDFAGDYIFFLMAAEGGCKFKSTGKHTYTYTVHSESISNRTTVPERRRICSLYVEELLRRTPDEVKFEWRKELSAINFDRWLQDDKPKISFLIMYYNQPKLLDKCIKSIMASDYPHYEIIVANDGSKHPKLDYDCNIKYYWHPHTISRRSTIRNSMMKMSSGDILFFLDADMEVTSNTVEKVLLRHYEHQTMLLIHYIYEDGETIRYIQRSNNMWQKMCGSFSIRKSVALRVGLMDESFNGGWGFEDTDWAYRAERLGVRIEHGKEIAINHASHKHSDLGNVNRVKFEKKHGVKI